MPDPTRPTTRPGLGAGRPRRRTSRAWRAAAAGLLSAIGLLVGPATAGADPAGPTDYRSEIVAVTPEVDAIEVSIAGGDSFVVLEVRAGTEVIVIGNGGEHYLRIDPGGDVWENQRSPDTYMNAERYGAAVPDHADAAAPPEWQRVGGGGSWAWHDHRAHHMVPFPPVNVDRGEPVLDGVVPLLVDGADVDVRVTSVWMHPPSRWPVALGLVAGLAVAGLARRRPAAGLMVVAAGALVIGAVQYRSLPPETDPLWWWWLAPLLAQVAGLVALWRGLAGRRWRTPDLVAPGAAAIGAVLLLGWWWERRTGLTRAILPTDAPFWLDRSVTAAAVAAGVGVLVLVAARVAALVRSPSVGPPR